MWGISTFGKQLIFGMGALGGPSENRKYSTPVTTPSQSVLTNDRFQVVLVRMLVTSVLTWDAPFSKTAFIPDRQKQTSIENLRPIGHARTTLTCFVFRFLRRPLGGHLFLPQLKFGGICHVKRESKVLE